MTKKDYEAFASVIFDNTKDSDWEIFEALASSPVSFKAGYREAVKNIAFDLIPIFEEDNSRFDKERFLKACGL